jgi:hypothetical protein
MGGKGSIIYFNEESEILLDNKSDEIENLKIR